LGCQVIGKAVHPSATKSYVTRSNPVYPHHHHHGRRRTNHHNQRKNQPIAEHEESDLSTNLQDSAANETSFWAAAASRAVEVDEEVHDAITRSTTPATTTATTSSGSTATSIAEGFHCQSFICLINNFEMLKTGDGYILRRLVPASTGSKDASSTGCRNFQCWISQFVMNTLSYGYQLRNKTYPATPPPMETDMTSLTPPMSSYPWQNSVNFTSDGDVITSAGDVTSSYGDEEYSSDYFQSYFDVYNDSILMDLIAGAAPQGGPPDSSSAMVGARK